MHIDYGPERECFCPDMTYGQICIKCNACGRFNPDRQKVLRARLWLVNQRIKDSRGFKDFSKDPAMKALQKKNMAANKESHARDKADILRELKLKVGLTVQTTKEYYPEREEPHHPRVNVPTTIVELTGMTARLSTGREFKTSDLILCRYEKE